MSDTYFESRFTPDPRRETLWRALIEYHFQSLIGPSDTVLELGAGYGHFINNVKAARRIALDQWDRFPNFLQPGIEAHVGEVNDLTFIEDHSLDFVFASNLFEHVSQEDFASVLAQLRQKLRPGGTFSVLQPNYRFAYREYFDDYTHRTVYSDLSICDFLQANAYEVLDCHPRFMPLTIKSRLKVSPLLIRLYLALPIRPMGKQMFVRARPHSDSGR
ncbi:MAG: class I SAM-dependent methyltransferase [Acidobacteria bacterium]|nr:class I SAM-dependent methyltransferase [Acidobacteriota bacterium]